MNRKENIQQALRAALDPMHLEVIDESHTHNVPEGAQSHFKVTVVSDRFQDQALIARHRQVNSALRAEFDSGLHALAIHAMTPEEWFKKGGKAPQSPPCLGGSKANP